MSLKSINTIDGTMNMNRPIVPVYLNQKLVFDLVAMLRGGISTVTAITSSIGRQQIEQQDVSAKFGLSDALSTLLSINLSGAKTKGQTNDSSSTSSEERVHTPASLFYELRNMLAEQKCLTTPAAGELPSPGDFVEFTASLKRNSIVETLDSLSEVLRLAIVFKDTPEPPKKGGVKNYKTEDEEIREQIASLSDALKAGSTIDLTTSETDGKFRSVVTVETEFLNDPFMSDLVDGHFNVLGKVIRSVATNDESISLLRKTALSKMPVDTLETLFAALSDLKNEKGFDVPEILWEVPGPAIQVLPVAIYA
ncbi:MAG: hypothetical protein OJF61_000512 [Rhodanobacteraceae bacterium]|jgi:hypothetical protein|nr:MAG: hypothetical protein OJF61_000512 [Rhodanobacteraceae bacterium]